MLIATLPTLMNDSSLRLAQEIISHPLVEAVRYNTGGDSPYTPRQILEMIKSITDFYKKTFYVDLEGRQVRVAHWTPQSRGVVILNHDFQLELPAKIHFRRMGWFEVTGVKTAERKIFFEPRQTKQEWFLGESQSVHIVAPTFKLIGKYLSNLDFFYIQAAGDLGINHFMLSFVEKVDDIVNFAETYRDNPNVAYTALPITVLKIESQAGIELVRRMPSQFLTDHHLSLMAARDDLFLSFIEQRAEFFDALKIIIDKDPRAILASRILAGLETNDEVSWGDMADLILMKQLGYKHFMFSDELSSRFSWVIEDWQKIIEPLLAKIKPRKNRERSNK